MADEKKAAKQASSKKSVWQSVKGFFGGIAKYLKDTKNELKKVVWPSKTQVKNNTLVVLAVVILAAIVLIVLDFLFGGLFSLLIGA